MHIKLYNIANFLLGKEENPDKKRKLTFIKEILKDKNCFFKIDASTACNIISDLGFNRKETLQIYQELINGKNYK